MFYFYFENSLNCFIKIFIFNFFIPMDGEPHHVAQGVVFHAVQVLHFRLVTGKLDTTNPCVHLSDSKLLVKWSRPKICIVREETFVINKADVCTRNKNASALSAVEMSKLNHSRPVDHFFISIFLQNCGSVSSQSCCALLS